MNVGGKSEQNCVRLMPENNEREEKKNENHFAYPRVATELHWMQFASCLDAAST